MWVRIGFREGFDMTNLCMIKVLWNSWFSKTNVGSYRVQNKFRNDEFMYDSRAVKFVISKNLWRFVQCSGKVSEWRIYVWFKCFKIRHFQKQAKVRIGFREGFGMTNLCMIHMLWNSSFSKTNVGSYRVQRRCRNDEFIYGLSVVKFVISKNECRFV